ncbi:hypothetical protein GCM10028801_36120 [Nocardioides maradonensis]
MSTKKADHDPAEAPELTAEQLEAEFRAANRRRAAESFEQPQTKPGSLLQYRPKRKARPRRRPVIDTVPGGGEIYGDVLPIAASNVRESNVVRYRGFEDDWISDLFDA